MAIFDNTKIGDRVYGWTNGWGTIAEIYTFNAFPLIVDFDNGQRRSYSREGFHHETDPNPTLFWDKPQFEIPKKPFDLKSEYKKLKRKEFVYGVNNYIIALKRDSDFDDVEVWYPRESSEIKMVGTCHYERDYIEEFTKLLNNHKVTFEQLEQVIKEVEDENK